MDTDVLQWSAHEHDSATKTPDWYWVLGIITVSAAIASLFFGQYLVSLMIVVAGVTLGLLGNSETQHFDFKLSDRGVEVDSQLFPYENLLTFEVIERDTRANLLVLSTETILTPHLCIPISDDIDPEDVRKFMSERVTESSNGVPFVHTITEALGL
ncbi:MAG: hypothetical protein WAX38_03110 [Minisyncoccia bacterium]